MTDAGHAPGAPAAERALELSARLVSAARDGRWDEVEILDADRLRAIEAAFAPDAPVPPLAAVRRLSELNEHLLELSIGERDKRLEALSGLRTRQRAASAYSAPD